MSTSDPRECPPPGVTYDPRTYAEAVYGGDKARAIEHMVMMPVDEATVRVIDVLPGPVMPEEPSESIRMLLQNCCDPNASIYVAIRDALIAEQNGSASK